MDLLATCKERTVFIDGAMGSELIRHGFRSETCPEEWNVTHPEVVSLIHREYFAAGADIVHTNTFGGTRAKLAHYGREGQGGRVQRRRPPVWPWRCATPTRRASSWPADMGPSGRFLKPMGDLEPAELRDIFAEQAAALVQGGVDLFSIETMFDLAEACLAVEAARAAAGGRPVMASLTYGLTARGLPHHDGSRPQARRRGAAGGRRRRGRLQLQPHGRADGRAGGRAAGGHQRADHGGAERRPAAPRERVRPSTTRRRSSSPPAGPTIVAQGANIVGGCCGTTPAHISALVKAIRG